MRVAIIDYGSGNLHSAEKAFMRAADMAGVTANIEVTADPEAVDRADRIVLPGVGAFADCRAGLYAVDGMVEALVDTVRRKGQPFLGICVGTQLMASRGHEHGTVDGLGWIEGDVIAIKPTDPALKIPHMGWNQLTFERAHPLFDGLNPEDHAYFVHSYHMRLADPADRLASADYGGAITAMVGRDNMVGTQFHPEKSQRLGLGLIGNFLTWCP